MKRIYRISEYKSSYYIEVLDYVRKGIFCRKVYGWYPCDEEGEPIKFRNTNQNPCRVFNNPQVAIGRIESFQKGSIKYKPIYTYLKEDRTIVENIDLSLTTKVGYYPTDLPYYTPPVYPK